MGATSKPDWRQRAISAEAALTAIGSVLASQDYRRTTTRELEIGRIVRIAGEPGLRERTAQDEGIEHVLAAVAGTVFRSETGEVIILLREGGYAIAVDEDGHTSSAHLVTVPPGDIAGAMDADRDEISGWAPGWEC
jgi:hypothetical protein